MYVQLPIATPPSKYDTNINKRASPYHKFDARLCRLADGLHSEDEEDISLKTSNQLYGCLEYDSMFSATFESVGTMDHYLRRICLWWKQAAQLRSQFISHLNEYQHALSYRYPEGLPEENYMLACYADCTFQIGQQFPLPGGEKEKTVSPERFYRAIIACTLDTKATQLVAILGESEDIDSDLREKIVDIWFQHSRYTLQESFENLEICDYTLNFLLRDVFNSPVDYLHWNQDIFQFRNRRNSLLEHWMFFHQRLQSFLTPFDVFSLFSSDIESDEMRGKISQYIDKFVGTFHVCEFAREVRNAENDVSRNLGEASSVAWGDYRSHHWRSAIRGRVFTDDFDVSDYNVPSKLSGRVWWKKLKHVESRPVHTSLAIRVPRFWFASLGDIDDESFSSAQDDFMILDEPLSGFLT